MNPVEQFMAEAKLTYQHAEGFHSVWPAPTLDIFQAALKSGNQLQLMAELTRREEAFRRWECEPIDPDWLRSTRSPLGELVAPQPRAWGYEPPTWREADDQLAAARVIVAAFGGNRQSKSWWALKRACEAARAYPGSTILILSETERSSEGTAQKIVWHYLRPWIEKFNEDHKRHTVVKVNYTVANGFTDGKLVLPNRSEMLFDTYKAEAAKYEGYEFGAKVGKLAQRAEGPPIQNIGFVADESCPARWLETLTRRSRFRHAKGIWAFTPKDGLTPAMKEFLGAPRILTDRVAAHLPSARVPGCRPGHMPRTAEPAFPGGRVLWFHVGDNPLGSYTQTVLESTASRSTEVKERLLYGYARDSVARAFPAFSTVHIIPEEQLPPGGLNYRIADPAGSRPYFMLWVRVFQGAMYCYRDWPDEARYGEWATATERETSEDSRKGWDGDRGPAQANLGWGYEQYKREWFSLERITGGGVVEKDPLRRSIQASLKPGETAQEPIYGNYIDPRAGPRPELADKGAVCAVWEFGREHRNENEVLPPIHFQMAAGLKVEEGRVEINDLLEYDPDRPLDPLQNYPRLFVSERCKQLIWALANWTGRAGDEGASKDPIDCLRMAVTSPLVVTHQVKPAKAKVGGY